MLDERKIKILYAIIDAYINSAEPVGSRTITKLYDLGVSPATIRNEMSDLEDLGYLNKPHSSSGRIPSDKAYRVYVDHLLEAHREREHQETEDQIRSKLENQSRHSLLLNASKLLSAWTNYTTILVTPGLSYSKVKHVNLSFLGDKEVLLTIMNDVGSIKNQIIRLEEPVAFEHVTELSSMLNHWLSGIDFYDISKTLESAIKKFPKYDGLIRRLIPAFKKNMAMFSKPEVVFEGITRILDYPEYKDIDKARSLLSFLEDEEAILEIFDDREEHDTIEIRIGGENTHERIKDCSIITASYYVDDENCGQIGLIGPMRMDYSSLLSTFDLFYSNIYELLSKRIT